MRSARLKRRVQIVLGMGPDRGLGEVVWTGRHKDGARVSLVRWEHPRLDLELVRTDRLEEAPSVAKTLA